MIQGLLIWLITLLASLWIVNRMQQRHKQLDRRLMIVLFFYHSLLALTYYLYALSNPSDSHNYYDRAAFQFQDADWLANFGTGTDFIEFISFFLVNKLAFTYESSMAFFAWLG